MADNLALVTLPLAGGPELIGVTIRSGLAGKSRDGSGANMYSLSPTEANWSDIREAQRRAVAADRWGPSPLCNLGDGTGLPVGPFEIPIT